MHLGGDLSRAASLRTEMRLIEQALAQDKPVLGICLGAQLLAHVLGAPVTRHSVSEIGWHQLHTTDAGREDAVLAPLGTSTPVFQWHCYTFAIPRSAQHLARTAGCENQAFRYGKAAYGFQFHLEVDAALIGRWLATPSYRNELLTNHAGQDPEAVLKATQAHAEKMKELAEPVFNNFLDLIGRPQRKIVLPWHL